MQVRKGGSGTNKITGVSTSLYYLNYDKLCYVEKVLDVVDCSQTAMLALALSKAISTFKLITMETAPSSPHPDTAPGLPTDGYH